MKTNEENDVDIGELWDSLTPEQQAALQDTDDIEDETYPVINEDS